MDADNELILAQQVIGEKNNEITHASKLIGTLDIRGAIVTADALNTQIEFAAKIIAEKADYCLALKANQDLTYEQVRGFFELGTHEYKIARPSVTDQGGKITKRKLEFFRELFYRKKFLINGLASMKDRSWKPSLTR